MYSHLKSFHLSKFISNNKNISLSNKVCNQIIFSLKNNSKNYHTGDCSYCNHNKSQLHGTTVLAVKRNNKLVIVADGQMTLGHTRFKTDTKKILKINEGIICGYAGSVADCTSLIENLEAEIEVYPTDVLRASVNLAKTWRTNKSFRNMQASLIVADSKHLLNLDGDGNIIEIKDGIIGIGSGGIYAQSAAKALYDIESLSVEEIAFKAMKIAAELCIYTNSNFTSESLECKI
jgi:ATP-dependent HslUV protease subunit HslV